jgi:hypothetical protein
VIRRARVLNCVHLGYVSSDIAMISNVDPKTVTKVGNAHLKGGLDSALYDEERGGRPIDLDDRPPPGSYRRTLGLIVEEAQKRRLVGGCLGRETCGSFCRNTS